jgi:hypothetical protein
MGQVVAVVTCDILGSRRYTTEERTKIDAALKQTFDVVVQRYRDAVHTPVSIKVIEGDEFQFVLAKPQKAYEMLIFYRALTALIGIRPTLTFRASIGVGEISVVTRKDSYSEDGQAFHLSRQGIDQFSNQKYKGKRRSRILTGDAAVNEPLDVILMYQDMVEADWTLPQWEAIRWRLVSPTFEKIAERIGVAYQNVQKRLKAAHWEEFSRGMAFIEKVLKEHP